MVNLDIGVHVDGWLADTAITVDLSGNPELAEASEQALEAALDVIEPGVNTGDIGAEIEDVINGYGYNPVVNLTGHGLGHWEQHTGPNIPNRAVSQGATLEVGDVVAIEPFATDGGGKVTEGASEEIFALEHEALSEIDRHAMPWTRSQRSSERFRLQRAGSRRTARRWRCADSSGTASSTATRCSKKTMDTSSARKSIRSLSLQMAVR